MEKPTFFARRAILVLIVVFFFVPFALRGARMPVQGMKNDVKDWLPKGFAETKDLDWFRKYFVSEQFVLVSWDGCHGDADDKRYQLFVAKLQPEIPPSVQRAAEEAAKAAAAESGADAVAADASTADAPAEQPEITSPTKYLSRDEHIGDRLGLYIAGNQQHFNWGDLQEKWLRGRKLEDEGSNEEAWYYITP